MRILVSAFLVVLVGCSGQSEDASTTADQDAAHSNPPDSGEQNDMRDDMDSDCLVCSDCEQTIDSSTGRMCLIDGELFDCMSRWEMCSTSPIIYFLSPEEDESVDTILRIRLEVFNFALVEPGGPNNEAEGHFRMYIDGESIVMDDPPVLSVQLDVRVCSLASDSPEEHTLEVDVFGNDGRPHPLFPGWSVTWLKSTGGC